MQRVHGAVMLRPDQALDKDFGHGGWPIIQLGPKEADLSEDVRRIESKLSTAAYETGTHGDTCVCHAAAAGRIIESGWWDG